MYKKLVSLSLLAAASIASVPAFAVTSTIAKTSTPGQITIFSNGSGVPSSSYFMLSSTDFPGTALTATKTLTSVSYTVAAYPGALSETVQLCYYRPYASAASLCKTVTPGSTSALTEFNSFPFGNGSELRTIHTVTGTPGSLLKPSRQESVTLTYRY